jgi:hypothetical protein
MRGSALPIGLFSLGTGRMPSVLFGRRLRHRKICRSLSSSTASILASNSCALPDYWPKRHIADFDTLNSVVTRLNVLDEGSIFAKVRNVARKSSETFTEYWGSIFCVQPQCPPTSPPVYTAFSPNTRLPYPAQCSPDPNRRPNALTNYFRQIQLLSLTFNFCNSTAIKSTLIFTLRWLFALPGLTLGDSTSEQNLPQKATAQIISEEPGQLEFNATTRCALSVPALGASLPIYYG